MGKKLAVFTTVDGVTYPAGSVPPDEVAEQITNPKAWAVLDEAVQDGPPPKGTPRQRR